MANFDPLHPLQSSILEVLAAEKELPMADLYQRLVDSCIEVSKPNLYRTVAQLVDAQVLVRTHGKISLNLVWIGHIQKFWDTVHQTYLDKSSTEFSFPLAENERREYHADSLLNLDPIWANMLIAMTKPRQEHPTYIYNSHPWYSLGMRDTEIRMCQAITQNNVCHMVYGNDTFLDRYGDKLIRVKNFNTLIAPDMPFPKEGYALWVCDEHILECIFPPVISRNFEYFFNTVQAVEQFAPELFEDVFRMKAKCKITVRRNKKEAEKLRAIFEKQLAQYTVAR